MKSSGTVGWVTYLSVMDIVVSAAAAGATRAIQPLSNPIPAPAKVG